jgi:hypothetical protein
MTVETPVQTPPASAGRRTRPRRVTLLFLGVLINMGLSLARLALAVQQWSFLSAFSSVPVLYLALTGLIWSVAGLILAWGLWRGRRWAPPALFGTALAYTFYFWADRLFIADPTLTRSSWPFLAGGNLVIIALIGWILSTRKARVFFGV